MSGQMSDRLWDAILNGRMEAFRAILASRSVDLNSRSFVQEAVRYKRCEMLEDLVQNGADVNIPASMGGDFPLRIAVVRGDIKMTKQLLRLGANSNLGVAESTFLLPNPSARLAIISTPLLVVIDSGWGETIEMMQILINAGADVNQADQDGYTPLLLAVEKGLPNVVSFLMKHGADPWILSPTGKTAYELASTEAVRQALCPLNVSAQSPPNLAIPAARAPPTPVASASSRSSSPPAWNWLCCCASVAPSIASAANAAPVVDAVAERDALLVPEVVVTPGPRQCGRFHMPAAPPRAAQAAQVPYCKDSATTALLPASSAVSPKSYATAPAAAPVAAPVASAAAPSSVAPTPHPSSMSAPAAAVATTSTRSGASEAGQVVRCGVHVKRCYRLPLAEAALSDSAAAGELGANAPVAVAVGEQERTLQQEQASAMSAQAQTQQQLARTTEEQARALEKQAAALREQAETILQLRQQLAEHGRTTASEEVPPGGQSIDDGSGGKLL